LPVMLSVLAICIGTPLDEVKLVRVWQIARCFVDLKRQDLELLYAGIRSNDVEELLIVSYETRGLDVFIATLTVSVRTAVDKIINLHGSISLVRHISCRWCLEDRTIEGSWYDCEKRIFIRNP